MSKRKRPGTPRNDHLGEAAGQNPAGHGTTGAQSPAGRLGEDPISAERMPVPEPPEPKKFNAPLWAGAVVVVGLVVVLLVNVLGHRDTLTVDALNPPAVAALDGGSEVYPANSQLAFTENVKFGYLPAPTLSRLGDGTVVAADPETAAETMGLPDGLEGLSTDEFLAQSITPPRAGNEPGTPLTWETLVDEVAGSTVLVPLISDVATARPALEAIAEADLADATIVRTADGEVARAAADADVAVMFAGDTADADARQLKSAKYTMTAVPAAEVGAWTDSGLEVWVTDVKDKAQLDELAAQGVFGALSTNPYAIQPSAVKTD